MSRGSSSKELVRALCATTAMMLLQRDTWVARKAERTAACASAARPIWQRGERIARGRCRDAYAALLAEKRGRADCQLRAAARRSE